MSQNGMVMPASRLLTFGRSGFAVLVGAIVIAGAALRCLRLDNGLWYDEGFSLHFARAESFGALLHELAKTTASERLQQLYTFLLHYWRGLFGESEHSLRALSVLLGTAAILLLADAARRLGGRQAALAAALLSLLDAWAADLVRPARGSRLAAVGAGVLLCLGSPSPRPAVAAADVCHRHRNRRAARPHRGPELAAASCILLGATVRAIGALQVTLDRTRWTVAALAALVLLNGVAIGNMRFQGQYALDDYRGVAAWLNSPAARGATPVLLLGLSELLQDCYHVPTLIDVHKIKPADLDAELPALTHDAPELIAVINREVYWVARPDQTFADVFAEKNYRITEHIRFGYFDLYRLSRR